MSNGPNSKAAPIQSGAYEAPQIKANQVATQWVTIWAADCPDTVRESHSATRDLRIAALQQRRGGEDDSRPPQPHGERKRSHLEKVLGAALDLCKAEWELSTTAHRPDANAPNCCVSTSMCVAERFAKAHLKAVEESGPHPTVLGPLPCGP